MRDFGNPAGRGRYSGFDRDSRMQTVIIVIHLMVVLAMTGVVLLQRSEGGGLGMGNTGGFLTSRGSANVLTRTTATLAAVFFATSLVLSILAGWDRKPHSILEGTSPATQPAGPAGAPQPLAPGGRGVLDTLRQQSQPSGQQGQPATPAAPAAPAPAGPQVPQSK
jgi:preprotein translocase subunit SecG